MKLYTEEHEWIEIIDEVARIGITAHAAKELGDITFIELPEVNATFAQGDVLCVVESVKAASDVYCPASGTVCEVNTELENNPEILNASAEANGWICKIVKFKEDEIRGLMTEEEYADYVS